MEWIAQTLSQALSIAPQHLSISIRIYVTSSSEALPVLDRDISEVDSMGSGYERKKSMASSPLLRFPAVELFRGRADLQVLLRDEVAANTGRLSVTGMCSSGPLLPDCAHLSVRHSVRFV